MKLKNILLIILTLVTLNSCCLINHSKTIKKIAEPMLNELDYFYKKNKRFPTLKERDEMLTTLGCKMKNNICFFHEENIVIESETKSYGVYSISMGILDNYNSYISHCGFGIKENGETEYIICFDKPCIEIRQ